MEAFCFISILAYLYRKGRFWPQNHRSYFFRAIGWTLKVEIKGRKMKVTQLAQRRRLRYVGNSTYFGQTFSNFF